MAIENIESKRGFLAEAYYRLVRRDVATRTSNIYRICQVGEQLGINPEQGEVFRDYFAGYFASKGSNLAQVETLLTSGVVTYAVERTGLSPFGWFDKAVNINFQVARDFLQSAENRTGVLSTDEESFLKDAANKLATTYNGLNDRHTNQKAKIRVLNEKIAALKRDKNRLG